MNERSVALEMPTFTVDIDIFKYTPKQLEKITVDIERAIERGLIIGMNEFAEMILERIELELMAEGVEGVSVMDYTVTNVMGNTINITLNDGQALYIEMGTGVVGEQNAHPNPDVVGASWWEYASGKFSSRRKGWWYPVENQGEDQTDDPRITAKNGEEFAYTRGRPSKPFMYRTWLWIRRSGTQILRRYINAEIRKVNGVK